MLVSYGCIGLFFLAFIHNIRPPVAGGFFWFATEISYGLAFLFIGREELDQLTILEERSEDGPQKDFYLCKLSLLILPNQT